jgi:hypothetical protein
LRLRLTWFLPLSGSLGLSSQPKKLNELNKQDLSCVGKRNRRNKLDNFPHFFVFIDELSSAGIAQLVEHRLPKPRVAGSIPVARSSRVHNFPNYSGLRTSFFKLEYNAGEDS